MVKTSVSEFTTGGQREIANCVAMLSSRLASVRDVSSVKPSVSLLIPIAAAAGTAP